MTAKDCLIEGHNTVMSCTRSHSTGMLCYSQPTVRRLVMGEAEGQWRLVMREVEGMMVVWSWERAVARA